MIEIMTDLPDYVIGFTAKGEVTGADYEKVIIPLVEEKLKTYPKINLLYHLGAEYEKFQLEAMWDDAKTGLHHLTAWQRIAMVSDVEWIRVCGKMFGFVMPGHVQVFHNNELEEARKWVSDMPVEKLPSGDNILENELDDRVAGIGLEKNDVILDEDSLSGITSDIEDVKDFESKD